jgi:glycosyltransferase involved in cell wall biosynthesis
MRVLHVHSGNMFGGVETFLLTLARCRTLAPSVEATFALCFDGDVAGRLRAEGADVSILGAVRLRRPDTVWRARKTLTTLLERDRFDVVVCHQSWPLAIFGPVAKSAGVPLVAWVHMAQPRRHWLDRLASRVEPDLFICNSRFTASTLAAVSAPVEVLYYPVFGGLTPVPRARAVRGSDPGTLPGQTARSATPASSEPVVIIQVSRMEAWKGQRACLDALGRLRHDTRWVCWQVGGAQRPDEEQYLAALRDDAERAGIADRVHFLGQRSDVEHLLASAHIFCQPNVKPEPFGIVYVEALLASLPVVASAIGAAPEIIDDSCGVLVRPDDPGSLAAALGRLIDDGAMRNRLGRAGVARARSLCDPAVQIPKMEALLQGVCGLRC